MSETALPENIEQQLRDFVTKGGATCFLTTTQKDGTPSIRQVAAFVEDGWVTGTISDVHSPKNGHVARTPRVSYIWVKNRPAGGPFSSSDQITLQGNAEVITDLEEVNAFLKRRSDFHGSPFRPVTAEAPRYLIRVTPTLLRSEGFVEGVPNAVIVARQFSPFSAERVLG